jgi:nucleobase:cation symporter-1, NCS1 family
MSQGSLENADLAPVPSERRTWRASSYAALWISMSACVPTYMLASSLVGGGMNWWQAILTIFLGNTIVLVPILLNAHAGTRYGIPFPVFCRASFGTHGANLPALMRALVACGWFGIQAWIGGQAIHKILGVLVPSLAAGGPIAVLGISGSQLACFLLFWGVNMWVVYKGIESIRILLSIKAPLLIALGLLFLVWAYRAAGGFGPMLSQPSAFDPGQPKAGQFWHFFVPGLTGMIGFWATLSLNIPDFSRYARSQRDQVVGQSLGLPLTMAFYSFIGVAVTSATTVIYGQTLWDPLDVLVRFKSPGVLIVSMVALCIATLATNIAANVVSPANDFSHLAPRRISFRTGGFITGIIGILMMPWKLVADPSGYIFTWLVGYSALLGPVGGIMIADYFVLRRTKLDVRELYNPGGAYGYHRGWSLAAITAFALAVLPSLPGFLAQSHVIGTQSVPAWLLGVYDYAWFSGFGIAFAVYLLLRKLRPSRTP